MSRVGRDEQHKSEISISGLESGNRIHDSTSHNETAESQGPLLQTSLETHTELVTCFQQHPLQHSDQVHCQPREKAPGKGSWLECKVRLSPSCLRVYVTPTHLRMWVSQVLLLPHGCALMKVVVRKQIQEHTDWKLYLWLRKAKIFSSNKRAGLNSEYPDSSLNLSQSAQLWPAASWLSLFPERTLLCTRRVFRPEITRLSQVEYMVSFPVLLLVLQSMAMDSDLKMEGKEIWWHKPALRTTEILHIQVSEY